MSDINADPPPGGLDLTCLDLPDIESFSPDERMLARVTVGIVRNSGAMYTGRFIECVVAGLLSARFAPFGVSPWDLVTDDGIRIEVKSGTKSFTLGSGKDVHVWVFAHKRPDGLTFTALPDREVAAFGQRRIAARRLARTFGEVGPMDLEDAVRTAARAHIGARQR